MSQIQRFLLVVLLLVAGTNFILSAAITHFTGFTENTGSNLTLVVPTTSNPSIGLTPLAAGDEIGVFTPGGLLIGAGEWDGTNSIAITVWGDNDQTVPVDGAQNGQVLNFRVWDKTNSIEYSSVTVSYSLGNGQYTKDGFYILGSLVAAAKPGKPSFTNPVNNGTSVHLSGTLMWNAAPGATSHTVQLSSVNDFSSTITTGNGNITSLAYSGLSNNMTYFARARGTNAEGDGDWETISFKTLLATPTLISPADNAVNVNTNADLTFNSVAGATSYLVEVSLTNNFAVAIPMVVNGTSATFNGLNAFTNYFWRVKAMDGANSSLFSAVRTFKTRVGTTTITNPVQGSVNVAVNGNITWTAVNGATSYNVKIIRLSDNSEMNQNIAGTSMAYSNLMFFENYEVRITAKNSDGSGTSVSSVFKTKLGAPVLTTPANNSFIASLNGNVTWNASAGATGYDIRIATDAGFSNIIATHDDFAGTSFPYTGLNNNTKYFWMVRAKNVESTSDFSSTFNFTTMLGTVTLIAPANNETQVSLNPTLSWNSVGGATTYHVQVSTLSNFSSLVFENTAVAGTSVNVNNLNGKTNYFFRVKAMNANNEGSFSAANMFTTVLGKVVLLTPANGAQGVIAANGTLTWQQQQGATSYDFKLSVNADLSNPIFFINQPNAFFNYAGLNNNTTYFWAVRANDGQGSGPYSDTWSFGTQISAPTLLTPLNNSLNIVLQGSVTYSAVAGATSYELQIATDANFNTVVFNQAGVNGTTANYAGLENNKLHFWRVRAFKGTGAGLWSSAFAFTTLTLPAPVLVFPPNNSIDLFTAVTLVWNPVKNATGYNVRVATDPGFINVVATGNNLGTTQFQATGLFTDRDYYWQVQTIGGQGMSNWSLAWKFRTYTNPVFDGMLTICENKSTTYTTTVSPLIDYNWTVTGGTIVGSSTGHSVNVMWGSAGQGTVKLTRTSAVWGNFSDNITKNVTKTSVANVDVTAMANTYYANKACLNEWVTISSMVNSSGEFKYSWKLNNIEIDTNDYFSYHFTSTGTYTFMLTATGMDCEAGTASVTVTVDGNCPVTIINDSQIYACKNESPMLITAVIGGSGQFNYAWTPAADLIDASVSSPMIISASLSKTYKLTLTDVVSGNIYYDLTDLTVRNSPSVSFSPASLVVHNNSSIDLTNSGTLNVNISGGTAPFTYSWRDNNGYYIDPTNVQPALGSNKYYLTITDANHCISVEKKFVITRLASKESGDIVAGLNGEGYMFSYPNPVSDDLNIFAEFGESQNVRLRIINLIGQEVMSLNLGSIESYEGSLNLSKLTSGAYTLIIEAESNTFVKTFIKQ